MEPLYASTKAALLTLIREKKFSDNRLPSETALCGMLGVGRTTLREALIALTREGFVSKLHGSGNLVHRSTLSTRMRIDTIIGFKELLEDRGYRVGVQRSTPRWLSADEIGELCIQDRQEERILLIESTYHADGHPAIFARNYLIGSFVVNEDEAHSNQEKGSFIGVLTDLLSETVENAITHLTPVIADSELAEILEVDAGIAVMQWHEDYYSAFDNLVCKSVISFNPSYVNLAMLRKWN